MIIKQYGKDFDSPGGALTLSVAEVSEENVESGVHERTHESGWTIRGEVHEDYYTWVNTFYARHPVYGTLFGDFEEVVMANSEEAFNHFWDHHQPEAWDYGDI